MPENGPGGPGREQAAIATRLKRGLGRLPQVGPHRLVRLGKEGEAKSGPDGHGRFQRLSEPHTAEDPAPQVIKTTLALTEPAADPFEAQQARSEHPAVTITTSGTGNIVEAGAPVGEVLATSGDDGPEPPGANPPGPQTPSTLENDANAGDSGDGGTTDNRLASSEGEDDDARARATLRKYDLWRLGRVASVFSKIIEDEPSGPDDSIPSGLAEAYILLRDDIVPSHVVIPDTLAARALEEPMRERLEIDAIRDFDVNTVRTENIRILFPDLLDAQNVFDAITHLNTSNLNQKQIEEIHQTIQRRMSQHMERLRSGEDMRDVGEASSEILRRGSITERLQALHYTVTGPAAEMLGHSNFATPEEDTTLQFARVNVGDLALTSRTPTYQEIIDHAQRLGLRLCPPWAAPAYLLARTRTRQRQFEQMGLAMEPMAIGREGEPSIFTVSGEVLGTRSGTTANIQENLLFAYTIA